MGLRMAESREREGGFTGGAQPAWGLGKGDGRGPWWPQRARVSSHVGQVTDPTVLRGWPWAVTGDAGGGVLRAVLWPYHLQSPRSGPVSLPLPARRPCLPFSRESRHPIGRLSPEHSAPLPESAFRYGVPTQALPTRPSAGSTLGRREAPWLTPPLLVALSGSRCARRAALPGPAAASAPWAPASHSLDQRQAQKPPLPRAGGPAGPLAPALVLVPPRHGLGSDVGRCQPHAEVRCWATASDAL